ncbi:glycan-binding surface protein [Maribellus mangrovi]|uniref:glycan-binding surface protein n=1 Tax=Maribellus mangrovi TaxID=3133146 RepID=UPI0030EE8CD7
MKTKFRYIYIALVAFSLTVVYSACNDSDDETSGTPRIDYIRITDPEASDSLLVSAGQGQLIAVIGENLEEAVAIEFNNLPATITIPYVTNTSILVRVPSEVPEEVTNQMVVFFKNGSSLTHDFSVSINKPSVTSMACEYVNAGGIAEIHGNYFYEPLQVIFPGDMEGEVVSVEDEAIKVIVPEGTSPGRITVKSNFGSGQSTFMFRDNRNIVISSDPFTGWWNESYVITNPGEGDPEKINGNYIRVQKVVSSWAWTEVAGGPASAMGDISKNIPDEAILHPDLYNLKFEINTLKPYNNNVIRLNFGLSEGEVNDAYLWNPPYDTGGEWRTVSIPYAEIVKSYEDLGVTMQVNPNGYWTRVLIFGNGDLDCDIAFDNFRIVPNKF